MGHQASRDQVVRLAFCILTRNKRRHIADRFGMEGVYTENTLQ